MKDKREALIQELSELDILYHTGDKDHTQKLLCDEVDAIADFIFARERSMREEIELLKAIGQGLQKALIEQEQENDRWKENFKNMMIERDDYIKKLTATMGKVREVLHKQCRTEMDCRYRMEDALAILNEAEGV